METRNHLAWLGAAVVVAVAVVSAAMSAKDDERATLPVERDLFAFIKPMDAITVPHSARSDPAEAALPRNGTQDTEPAAEQTTNRGIPEEFMNKPSPSDIAAVEQSVQQMRARGASEDEVYRARAQALSAETAARLASMEGEESAWQARVNAYIAERNALTGSTLQTSEAQFAMQKLRNARFTPEEQERLDAYEWDGVPRLVTE
ncbi:hypothetical protein GCM10027343_37400 [Noviherbaspirillum agri]